MKSRTVESVVIGNDKLDAEGAELPGWVLVERDSDDPEKTAVLAVALNRTDLESSTTNTVTIVQVRADHLRELMVARPHGTTEPWRSVDAVIPGDSGRGIEDVVTAAGGDIRKEGHDEIAVYARWPFESPNQPVADVDFHNDDVAIVYVKPDRKGQTNQEWSHHLLIQHRYTLWDVQVLTPIQIRIRGNETYRATSEGAA